MQPAISLLQEHQIRPSAQRLLVFNYLRSVCCHPSVDAIYQALLPDNPTLSRTTVYNTLELLVSHGLALSLDFGEGFLRYDGDVKPHSHFKCTGCGAVIDIEGVPKGCESLAPKGAQVSFASLYLFGRCAKCGPAVH